MDGWMDFLSLHIGRIERKGYYIGNRWWYIDHAWTHCFGLPTYLYICVFVSLAFIFERCAYRIFYHQYLSFSFEIIKRPSFSIQTNTNAWRFECTRENIIIQFYCCWLLRLTMLIFGWISCLFIFPIVLYNA